MKININILIRNFERRLLKGNYSTFLFYENHTYSPSTAVNSNYAPKLNYLTKSLKTA